MNETELKKLQKIITAKNLLIKAIKLLNLRKKNPCPSNYSTVIAMGVASLAVLLILMKKALEGAQTLSSQL